MSILNPFPRPDSNSRENKLVVEWVKSRIDSPRGLTFHDCLEKVEEFISQKNIDMALVAAYYTTNIVKNSKNIKSVYEKNDIIMGLKDQIEKTNQVK